MRTFRLMQGGNALGLRALAAGGVCAVTAVFAVAAGGTIGQAAIYAAGIITLAALLGFLENQALAEAAAEGRRAASRDPVTELASGAVAEHFVASEYAAAQRGRHVTVVIFGLDHFDAFAVSHGGAAADRAVREFGQLLKRLTRRMNLSARYGWRADTFISVLSDSDAEGAEVFVQRVRSGMAECNARMPMPTVSVGLAEYDPAISSPEEFVEWAESALAEARSEGGNCTRVRRVQVAAEMRPDQRWLKAL